MTEETRISIALERIATALETIAECEIKSVALSNKFADTNESMNKLLKNLNAEPLRVEKPPNMTKEEFIAKLEKDLKPYREKFKLQSYTEDKTEINSDSWKDLIADEKGRPAFDRFGNRIEY